MKDETKAAIFCLIWELFAYIGLFTYIFSGSTIGWYIFAIDTAVQITILYFDAQLESAKKAYKQAKRSLSKISAEYTQYIRDTSTCKTTVFEVTSFVKGHKVKKIHKKVS